jgi:hypothetical protein
LAAASIKPIKPVSKPRPNESKDRRRSTGDAGIWPLAACSQQMARLPTVGFLDAGSPATADVWVSASRRGSRELGWIEDRNIKIDLRWAEGRNDRSAEIAADFVRLRVDVIVTYSSEHTQIAKQATSITPIVFALAADPVGSGLVATLARRAAISLACQPRTSNSPTSGSSCCARSSRACVGWRSCSTATTRPP